MAGEVQTPHAQVTIAGTARTARSVRITREIATDMPGEVVGGGGMVAATGSVDWLDEVSGIGSGRVQAPKPLQTVTVSAGVDGPTGGLARRFTGQLDSSGGRASDVQTSSSIVDRTRSLDKPVTVPVHLEQEVSDFGDITNTGLSSMWMVHEVARQLSWPQYHYSSRSVLWASLAGSILPANTPVGSYTTIDTGDPLDIVPTITPDDGLGLSLVPKTRLAFPLPPLAAGGNKAIELSFWCDPGEDAILRVEVFHKSAANEFDGFVASAGGGSFGSYRRAAAEFSTNGSASGWQALSMHLSWTTSGWYLQTASSGGVLQGDLIPDTGANALAADDGWELLVTVASASTSSAVVAGLVVDRLPDATPRWAERVYVPRLKVRTNLNDIQQWSASRLIQSTPGIDILRGIAEAECAGVWIDEDGALTWMSRNYMRLQPVARTLSSSTNLLDYSWSDSLDSNRSSVIVKHLMPAFSVRAGWNLTVWAANSDTRFKANERSDQFVEPESLEDWWQPDLTISRGDITAKPVSGTWWGGRVRVDSTDAIVRTATTSDAAVTMSKIGPQKAHLTIRAASNLGSANYLDTTGTPVVRARGRVVWTEQEYTSDIVGSPDAPALEHDTGWYVQWENPRRRLADYLANTTNGNYPTIDGVEVVPDPAIRLGEKVNVRDSHVKGFRFDGVVFRIDESWEDGRASMTLGLRVTSFSIGLGATLAQLDARWKGSTLAQFDAAQSGKTLAQFDALPLA